MPRVVPATTVEDESESDAERVVTEPERTHVLLGDLVSAKGVLPEKCTTYVYRVDTSGKKVPPGFDTPAYSLKYPGVPDFETIRAELGGGFFQIVVTGPGGKMVHTANVPIEGEPRASGVATAPAATAPAPASPGPDLASSVVSALAPVLEAQTALLRELANRQAIAPPAADPIEQMTRFAALFRELQPPRDASASAQVATYVEVLQKGMDLGRAVEGGRTTGDAIVELGPQIMATLQQAMQSRPPAPARPVVVSRPPAIGSAAPATSAAPGATAAPAPEPAPAVISPGNTPGERVQWLVTFLASQRTLGVDPAEAADLVEPRLSEIELATLRQLTAEQALAQLGENVNAFPVLVSAEGRVWLDAFLDELRAPDEDDSEDAPTS